MSSHGESNMFTISRRDTLTLSAASIFSLISGCEAEAAPADTGVWSQVYDLPIVPIHAMLLPTGNLLFYQDSGNKIGTPSGDATLAYVAEIPMDGGPTNITSVANNAANYFCGGHAQLPDGRFLIIGGQKAEYYHGIAAAVLFEYTGGYKWVFAGNMQDLRWYPSAITLATGEILAIGGTKLSSGDRNKIPEVWKTTGGWRALPSASLGMPPYAWVFQAPNGKVLFAGPTGSTRYLDTTGSGKWSAAPARKQTDRTRGAAVMYNTGKILLVGGGSATAEKIDLLATTPAWQTVAPMKFSRIYHHATVLPDGTVLVTGGQNSSGPVRPAELWNPDTGTWTTLASAQKERGYHSIGLLLPDGRVLSAGGGRKGKLIDQKNMEIFSPPYFFNGARPTIGDAPASAGYGQSFQVTTLDAPNIGKVSLIKLSSVTHSFNMGQRFNALTFSKGSGALSVTAPANANLAPPGYYMLFIVSSAGVPSVAKIIKIS
jgi:galactose oxidase